MVERGSGMVINVSSMAGWFPGGTYSAAKSWVTVFSESLSVGLEGSGVRVIAVCPGFIRTEFHERAGMDMTRTPDWMWLDVPMVVDRTFRDLALGRSVSVAGSQYPAFARILQHGPRTFVRRFAGARTRLTRRGD
jgi:short-subunit dehydrogenase